ncbi:MAG: dipeptidase [Phycisphaerae bacterium]|nr:dipeptidase [Phycisphaerae bacterium]
MTQSGTHSGTASATTSAALALEPVLATIEKTQAAAVERLAEFLRIPSISTDPAFDADTTRCAEWAAAQLRELGFRAEVVKTIGHPMVLAHHDGPSGQRSGSPRILYYGHYDVQPADPLELWTSPAFEPAIVDGHSYRGKPGKRIVARGAVDDKGQVMTFIEAFRAWHATHGTLPCAVTVMLEGEEESGSKSFEPFLKSHKEKLAADVCVVSDTGMWDIETPAITTRLRGLVYVEVTLHGPSLDLHSGMYGGTLVNPINALAAIVGKLHDADRRVQLKGFYDNVEPLPDAIRAQWAGLAFDEMEFLGEAGVKHPYGEKGTTTMERMWSRPTCDCNGIYGGYTGKGAKTVIPAHATVKLSCRLVANQDPAKVHASIEAFFKDHCPPGCRIEMVSHGMGPAISVPTDSVWLRAAAKALKATFGKEAALIGTGGSIPAVGLMQRELGIDSLLVGFGLDDDHVHSPNEKFELWCYRNGIEAQARMLAEFAATPRA